MSRLHIRDGGDENMVGAVSCFMHDVATEKSKRAAEQWCATAFKIPASATKSFVPGELWLREALRNVPLVG